MHYLNLILAFISHHSWLAYGIIVLVAFSESLALVGLLVPGTLIMFAVGAVVATGSLQLAPVLVLAMAGAVGTRLAVLMFILLVSERCPIFIDRFRDRSQGIGRAH